MGIFSEFGTILDETISKVCNLFTSSGSALGTAVAALATLFPPLSPLLPPLMVIVEGISVLLGILKTGENAEEIGMKAKQAAEHGLTQEQFQSRRDYLEAIRKESIDRNKMMSMSEEERITCRLAGTRILGDCLSEKLSIPISNESLLMLSKLKLAPLTALNCIENLKKKGSETPLEDIGDYLKENIDISKLDNTSEALSDAIKEENPEATEKDIATQIQDWTNALNEDKTDSGQ